MSKLLINEHPLQVLPSLAEKIGLNEAIILQQIHYWNESNRRTGNNYYDGYYWAYNSYEQWREQFPFWHKNTIARAIRNLEDLRLIVSANYNKLRIDRTKWYRIDYSVFKILEDSRMHQIGTTNKPKWYQHLSKLVSPIPETTTETTTETTLYLNFPVEDSSYLKIYNEYFMKKFSKNHMRVTKEQLSLITGYISALKACGISTGEYEDEVIEHFATLPDNNNGNILAFVPTLMRRFGIAPRLVNCDK